METVDQLICARWILPIAPKNIVLENHAIAIKDGLIKDILPADAAKEQFYAQDFLDLNDHVLMPGLVNTHAHTPMNLFRGLADDLELMDWLNNHIWPAEKELINAESVIVGSRLAIAEMLRGGTTCFNDHYFFPSVTGEVAMEEGIRASLGCVIMSVPTEWAQDEATYVSKALQILENQPDNPLITWTIAPHAPYTVSDDSFKKVKELSERFNLPVHLHLHETAFECEQSIQDHGKRPIQRMADLGLLNSKLIAVHMTQMTDDEIKQIKDSGTHVAHCPESNLKLASGFAPINKLLDADINVSIGTDGAASNNDLDMFGELRTAALIAKAVSGNPTCLPAAKALEMATINGAKALGLDDKIGSLEPGKAADMIAVDFSSYLTRPIFNPMSHLVYAINRLQVSDVWVAGKRLLKDGKLTKLNTEKLIQRAQELADKAKPFQSNSKDKEEALASAS